MRRLLLIADLVGLVGAFLLALAFVSPSGCRRRQHALGGRTLRCKPAVLGAPRADARAVRPGRGADGSLDDRRHLRHPPGGLDRNVGIRRGHRDRRPPASDLSRASWSSGGSRSSWFLCSARSCASRTAERRVRPERHHRRVRPGGAPAGQQDRQPSRVRTEDRRLRRSRRGASPNGDRPSSSLERPPTFPIWCASTRCTASRSPRRIRTSRRSRSSARCRTATSRSTSSRACSRCSGRTPSCTRSRASPGGASDSRLELGAIPQALVRPARREHGPPAPAAALPGRALAVKLDSRGPVFFRQVRMGPADARSTSSSSEP